MLVLGILISYLSTGFCRLVVMPKPEIGMLHRWYYQNVVDIVDTGGSNLSVVPEKDLESKWMISLIT